MIDTAAEGIEEKYVGLDEHPFHQTKPVSELAKFAERNKPSDRNQDNMEALFKHFSDKKTGDKVSASWPKHSAEATILLRNDNESEQALRLQLNVTAEGKLQKYDLLLRKEKNGPDSKWSAHSLSHLAEGNPTSVQLPEIYEILENLAGRLGGRT